MNLDFTCISAGDLPIGLLELFVQFSGFGILLILVLFNTFLDTLSYQLRLFLCLTWSLCGAGYSHCIPLCGFWYLVPFCVLGHCSFSYSMLFIDIKVWFGHLPGRLA
jgi:hypothetical protein